MLATVFLAGTMTYALFTLWLARRLGASGLRVKGARPQAGHDDLTGAVSRPLVTVLVAARDEEENLPRLLEALLVQDWPQDRMQIVVVNDRSTDGTHRVLRRYATRYPDRLETLEVAILPPGFAPKKHALMRGLERARGEWIAVTDADCTMGPRWLASLAGEFRPEAGMVLGPVLFEEPAEGFGVVGGAAALEFAAFSVSAAALVGAGFPVIASANNLAYRRIAFDDAGGFARHDAVVNGDDDLLLQDIHRAGSWTIRHASNPDAVVRTLPPMGWRQFWEQRKRWAGACLHYHPSRVGFLLFVYAMFASIAGITAAGIFLGNFGWVIVGFTGFVTKTLGDFVLLRKGIARMGAHSLLPYFPVAALAQIPLVLVTVIAGSFGRSNWKGQNLGRKV
jgi:cellulose synthase/poly-beta-1,6-N-acetylglucosamine synthase-like glycosyltransferase